MLFRSGNVSSVTKSSSGLYTITFTTAMTDATYAWMGNAGDTGNYGALVHAQNPAVISTTSFTVYLSSNQSASHPDSNFVTVAVFR